MNTLMVAGAPRATYGLNDLPVEMRPKSPGGLFSCPMTTTRDDCSRVTMDKGGKNYRVLGWRQLIAGRLSVMTF